MKVNYEEAFRLLSLPSGQGASSAIVNLADMYAQGLAVRPDIARPIELHESVGTCEFFAARALGRIYSQELGVQENREKAFKWYAVVTSFETPGFNYEALRNELNEAKEYL